MPSQQLANEELLVVATTVLTPLDGHFVAMLHSFAPDLLKAFADQTTVQPLKLAQAH